MNFKLSLITLVVLSCPALGADDGTSQFVSRVDKIEFNQMASSSSTTDDARTDRIVFTDADVCGSSRAILSSQSLGLSRPDYRTLLKTLWQQSKNDEFFSVTTSACNGDEPVTITHIEPCKQGVCDDQYLIQKNVVWLDPHLEPSEAKDAVIAVKLPLSFDKHRQAWRVRGWYTEHPEHATTQISQHLALSSHYSGKDLEHAHPVGVFTRYYPNGQKQLVQHYDKDGNKIDTRTEWYKNGVLKETATYVDGQLDGVVTHYHQNGKVESTQVYIRGQHQDGDLTHYDAHGKMTLQQHYLNGLLDGEYVDYYPSGRVHVQRVYTKGVIEQSHTYTDAGNLTKTYRLDGDKSFTDLYNEQGELVERDIRLTDEMGTYLNSRELRYANGKTKSMTFYSRSGRKEGDMTTWYDNGQMQEKQKYHHGERQAVQRWARNGTMTEELFFHNGLKNAMHRKWSGQTGKLIYEVKYHDGKVVSPVKTYVPKTGRLLSVEYQTADGQTQAHFVNGNPPLKVYGDHQQIMQIGCGQARLNNPEQIKAEAKQGNSQSQYTIAQFYASCHQTKPAIQWFTKAAASNNIQAIGSLIHIYLHGEGVFRPLQSNPKAWRYIKQASDLHSPLYAFEEGFQYLPKSFAAQHFPDRVAFSFVQPDAKRALALIKQAYQHDPKNYTVLRALGLMYQYGIGTPVSHDKAIAYFEKMGDQDPAQAQTLIDQVK